MNLLTKFKWGMNCQGILSKGEKHGRSHKMFYQALINYTRLNNKEALRFKIARMTKNRIIQTFFKKCYS